MVHCFFPVFLSPFKNDLFLTLFLCVYVIGEARSSSAAGVVGNYEPPNVGAEKLGSLEEQQVLFTIEPPFYPMYVFSFNSLMELMCAR